MGKPHCQKPQEKFWSQRAQHTWDSTDNSKKTLLGERSVTARPLLGERLWGNSGVGAVKLS